MYRKNKLKAKKLCKENKEILENIIFIGITGTNGKTTTTTLLYKYFRYNNYNVTLIGTNGIFINDDYYETINTTPGVEKLFEIIKKSYNLGVRIIIMEVSSHAIVQNRVYGIKFNLKGLTNITWDHLDYHKSFEEYKKIKLSFMKKAKLLINKNINIKIKNNKNLYTYGKEKCDYQIKNIEVNQNYSQFVLTINNIDYRFKSNLLGEFNVYNITLFISALHSLNYFNYNKIVNFLNRNININGRMQLFNYNRKTIIVDYAHTPDGMDKVLSFVRNTMNGKIITLFGCGGNRDVYKRKIMGEIASNYSDLLIITNDNPRNEDENKIINNILEGVSINYLIENERKEAIDLGIKLLNEYNVLLVLGRGCENAIIKNNELIQFNDVNYIKQKVVDNG